MSQSLTRCPASGARSGLYVGLKGRDNGTQQLYRHPLGHCTGRRTGCAAKRSGSCGRRHPKTRVYFPYPAPCWGPRGCCTTAPTPGHIKTASSTTMTRTQTARHTMHMIYTMTTGRYKVDNDSQSGTGAKNTRIRHPREPKPPKCQSVGSQTCSTHVTAHVPAMGDVTVDRLG